MARIEIYRRIVDAVLTDIKVRMSIYIYMYICSLDILYI